MGMALEDRARDGAADQRRGDIVEEAGDDGDDDQQHAAALPAVGR